MPRKPRYRYIPKEILLKEIWRQKRRRVRALLRCKRRSREKPLPPEPPPLKLPPLWSIKPQKAGLLSHSVMRTKWEEYDLLKLILQHRSGDCNTITMSFFDPKHPKFTYRLAPRTIRKLIKVSKRRMGKGVMGKLQYETASPFGEQVIAPGEAEEFYAQQNLEDFLNKRIGKRLSKKVLGLFTSKKKELGYDNSTH